MPRFNGMVSAFCMIWAAVSLSASPSDAVPTNTVRLWIRAFIPNSYPGSEGYIIKASNGKHLVPAPSVPFMRNGATTFPTKLDEIMLHYTRELDATCFSGDDRTFSDDPTASSRVSVDLKLVISGRNVSVAPAGQNYAKIGPSHHVDCATGVDVDPPRSAPESGVSVGNISVNGFDRSLFVRVASPNPFFNFSIVGLPEYALSPDIDFSFTMKYNIISRKIELNGTAGTFPAFEGYYKVDEGPIKTILKLEPAPGATALSLFDFATGVNSRNFSATISLR